MEAKYTIREISLALVLLLIPSVGFAVDDATISVIDSKASNANEKADSNNSRIQKLEIKDVEIETTIAAERVKITANKGKADKNEADLVAERIKIIANKTKADKNAADILAKEAAVLEVVNLKAEKLEVGLIKERVVVLEQIEPIPGPQGADGTQGAAGINCWDLNGDGVDDPNEDIDGNGVFNAADCNRNVDLSVHLTRLLKLEERLLNSDLDNDGFTPATGDCNDANFDIHPGIPEICDDNIDNNCDGQIDEGCTSCIPVPEICGNAIDDDCNGMVDEDCFCEAPTTCDDGLACTIDTCDAAAEMCINDITAGMCLIGGNCYSEGEISPGSECQICNAGAYQTGWSNQPVGTACSGIDGNPNNSSCDGTGVCIEGT